MKKLETLILAILFPFVYFCVQWLVLTCASGALYAIKRAEAPDISEEVLQNRVNAAFGANVTWFLIIAAVLMFFALVLFFRLTGTGLTKAVRFRPLPRAGHIVRLMAIGLGLNLILMGLLQLIPIPDSWTSEHTNAIARLSGAGILAQAVLVLICASVMEEVLFRGLALSYLQKGFSPVMAVVLQAALFGVFHGTRLQIVYAFMAGLVFGFVALRFKSVTAPIIAHTAFNGVTLIIGLLRPISG